MPSTLYVMHKRGKRGQLTIFVIIAIIIVALVVLAIIFIPRMAKPKIPSSQALDPAVYVSDCINQELEPMVETLSVQGGYIDGDVFCVPYNDFCRQYLCFSTQNKPCSSTWPLLKEHIEAEIKDKLQTKSVVKNCIDDFAASSRAKGYETTTCNTNAIDFSVNISEGRASVPINCQITLEKGQEVKKFNQVVPAMNSPLYDFIILAQQIILEEQKNGKFDFATYDTLPQNRAIQISLMPINNNIKIYTLKELKTNKEFTFAVSGMYS